MRYLARARHRVGAPFLHAGSIDVLSRMLSIRSQTKHLSPLDYAHTSNVIHDIGWSSGISVRLTNLSSCVSSSNCTVNIAPGDVLCGHVSANRLSRQCLPGSTAGLMPPEARRKQDCPIVAPSCVILLQVLQRGERRRSRPWSARVTTRESCKKWKWYTYHVPIIR